VTLLRKEGISFGDAASCLGTSSKTIFRYLSNPEKIDGRKGSPRRVHNKLTKEERDRFLQVACSKEFVDLSPSKIVPILATRGEYFGSESTLSRILKENQLNKHRRRERVATHHQPESLVATGPNQVWSWDVTYLRSRVLGKHFYCYLFMDVYSRKIVGWTVREKECGKLASDLLIKSCNDENVGYDELSLHQDNGAVMRGSVFMSTMSALGVKASYSRPGVSDDNPFSESLFRTMKYRTWYPETPFSCVEDASKWMNRFVNWYNEIHLHSGIKFVTPNDRHSGQDAEILKKRRATYEAAKELHPERWSGKIRNWDLETRIELNPKKRA